MAAKLGLFVTAVATILWAGLSAPASAENADTSKEAEMDREFVMPVETKEEKEARMAWWRDARYGLFIHWGPSSILGTETSWGRNAQRTMDCTPSPPPNGRDEVYDNLYKQFDPVEFDADEWVQIARDAGMKYLVFTTKHHDGFSNFHTEYSDYDIANTPFRRDIVRELSDACHRAGLRLGLYYSPRDWYHPDYLIDDNRKYLDFFHGQLREILGNYGKVDIIWFDSMGGDWKDWDYPELADIILSRQPDILCNGRIGCLQARTPRPDFDWSRLRDYQTPEQVIGAFQRDDYWESCTTLVDGQWGYKPDGLLLTFREVLGMVLYAAGGDGNLLLNIGPTPTGRIEPRQAERLREVGAWLAKYGETIYGTRGGPYKPGYWGASTLRDNRIFLHCLNAADATVTLPSLGCKVLASRVLSGGEVAVEQTDQSLTVQVSGGPADVCDTIVELTLDGPALDIEPMDVPGSGSLLAKRAAVSIESNGPKKQWWHNPCGPHQMFDDCRLTSWVPDPGATTVTATLDLGEPVALRRAVIDYDGPLEALEVCVREGEEWRRIGLFENPSRSQDLPLDPSTAQGIRFEFRTNDSSRLRVWDVEVF